MDTFLLFSVPILLRVRFSQLLLQLSMNGLTRIHCFSQQLKFFGMFYSLVLFGYGLVIFCFKGLFTQLPSYKKSLELEKDIFFFVLL